MAELIEEVAGHRIKFFAFMKYAFAYMLISWISVMSGCLFFY